MDNETKKLKLNKKANELLDKRVMAMLRKGTKIAVVGGEVQEIDLTAADLEFCRKRLKDIGLPKLPEEEHPMAAFVRGLREEEAAERGCTVRELR